MLLRDAGLGASLVAEQRRQRVPEGFVGATGGLRRTRRARAARRPDRRPPVLILGESGTGKELIAQALHEESPRRDRSFIKVNCAALSETLLESELFGHEKGAFTGAIGRKEGRFELADGGTLFLDEIGDISPALQIKLLRVLQQKEFERVGGVSTLKVDVRLVAATNRDLASEVKSGKFREDLYYRLNVVAVTLPPLRQRKGDIPALVSHFIEKYGKAYGKEIRGLAPGTLNALLAHDWPGNVRELENVVERAVVLAKGQELTADDLPAHAPRDRRRQLRLPSRGGARARSPTDSRGDRRQWREPRPGGAHAGRSSHDAGEPGRRAGSAVR